MQMKSIHDEQLLKSKPVLYDHIKKLITDTAEIMFKKNDFNAISMSDLASVAGISEKTIYEYFVSKAELVDYVISKQIAIKEKELAKRVRLARNPIHEAFIAWHIIDEFVQRYNFNSLLQIQKSFQQAFEKIMAFKNEFLFQLFKSNVDRGITDGLYRNTIKSDIISRHMVDISFMPGNSKDLSRAGHSLMGLDNQLLTYHLHGLATEKGVSLIRRYKNEALAQNCKYLDSFTFHS